MSSHVIHFAYILYILYYKAKCFISQKAHEQLNVVTSNMPRL